MNVRSVRNITARTFAITAIVGAAGLGAAGLASAQSYTASDLAYLAVLDDYAITYTSEDFAIDMGHEICYSMDQGASIYDVAVALEDYSSLSDHDNGVVIGAAIGAYCPEYTPA
ncbi:MAG TPA: DUF732 domain-containing protein [Aldersonia sp.]